MVRLLLATILCFTACRQDIGEFLRNAAVAKSGSSFISQPDAPAVVRIIPEDNASGIGTGSKIHIGFSAAMNASTIDANTVSTACIGTIQVSPDNFSTCVRMSSLQQGFGVTLMTVVPALALSANTRYQVRVTANAQSVEGVPLAATYSSTYGFTTASGSDTRPPVIQWLAGGFTSPYEMESGVPTNTAINVTFQEPVDPLTMRVNTTDTTCNGNIQLSADVFTTCVIFASQPISSISGTTYTTYPATPLNPSSNYRVRFLNAITDLSGNSMLSTITIRFSTAASAHVSSFDVTSTTPTSGAIGVSVSPILYVNFTGSRPVDPTTVALNGSGTSCTGTVQVSANNFATCTPIALQYIGSYFETLALHVLTPFANSTTYKIRVTSGLKDIYGNAITPFTQATGFTTTATTTGSTIVNYLAPLDNSAVSNEIYVPFTANFLRVMNPATITASTSGTACTGSFQVSADNFSTCLPMSSQPVAFAGNTRFTVYPQSPLAVNTVYRTRLTTAVQDSGGGAITAYNGSGVTTMP